MKYVAALLFMGLTGCAASFDPEAYHDLIAAKVAADRAGCDADPVVVPLLRAREAFALGGFTGPESRAVALILSDAGAVQPGASPAFCRAQMDNVAAAVAVLLRAYVTARGTP